MANEPTHRGPDKKDSKDPKDPKAPKPEKDETRLRDTSRPAHPDEREKDRS